jgi:hypothetical protein
VSEHERVLNVPMKKPKKDPVREDRIHNEAIVTLMGRKSGSPELTRPGWRDDVDSGCAAGKRRREST